MKEATVFKRKIYQEMLQWKAERNGETALLIEGARRIGKSTIVEEFAQNEYDSYILIDFSKTSSDTNALFEDLSDLDYIFLRLQLNYHVSLKERKSLIIFDEVSPIEVKSSGYKAHKSLDQFAEKYSSRVARKYLIYTKDLKKDGDTLCLPVYMVPLLP